MVCVRKPNLLAFRGDVRKPGDSAGRVQEGPAGLGLRTKTEFIGLQGRRTQTGRLCRPGSGGAGRPWFAYENRIHWLTEEAYANRETLPAEFRRVRPALVCVRKPNSLAYRGSVRKPGGSAGRVQEGPAAKVRARKPNLLTFTGDEREPGRLPSRFRARPEGGSRPTAPQKKEKTLKWRALRSTTSKFLFFLISFPYKLHPIYKGLSH